MMSEQRFHLAFQFLKEEAPAAARLLEQQTPADVAAFLCKAPVNASARVLVCMIPDYAASVLALADHESSTAWMQTLDTPALCAILRYLDDATIDQLLNLLPLKRQAACQLLLSYRADMVGAWAETDVPVATDHMAVGEVIKRLRRRQFRDMRLLIVLDEARQPIGIVTPAELFQANEDLPVRQLMASPGQTLRGRVTLATAIKQELWTQQDCVLIVNRHRQWVGLLWHSQLRTQLGLQVAHPRLSETPNYAVNQILNAHGDSMRALFAAMREGFKP